jgi:hypothetical protein
MIRKLAAYAAVVWQVRGKIVCYLSEEELVPMY